MNVSFFLLPKVDVVWISVELSVREAFARMEATGYTAIPVLDANGSYAGTITEGDLLRHMMHAPQHVDRADRERVRIAEVPRRLTTSPVDIDADVEQLFERAIKQNFVPVQDSRGAFIGIVPRRKILE